VVAQFIAIKCCICGLSWLDGFILFSFLGVVRVNADDKNNRLAYRSASNQHRWYEALLVFYHLVSELTLRNAVLIEKITFPQSVQKFPEFYEILRAHYPVHKRQQLITIQIQHVL